VTCVSILMANHNGGAYLEEAVRSVQQQTLEDWRLHIVDDGSSDDSLRIASALAADDERIAVLASPDNRGPAAARNRALDMATGDWLAIVDSDDVLEPSRLDRLIAVGEETGAEIIADNLQAFDAAHPEGGPLVRGRWARPRWITLHDWVDCSRLYTGKPDLGFLKPLIRNDALRRTRVRYDERLRIGEDFDLIARLLAAGLSFWFDPSPLYRYRRHAGSVSWRSRVSDIQALIQAHDDLIVSTSAMEQAPEPLRRRRRSLVSMLAYEEVIACLKAADPRTACMRAMQHPAIWPLLTRPIRSRLAGLFHA
jgi:succinoglycan biosynthesis protein ExoO